MREQRGHLSAEELRELNEFTVEDERVPSPEHISRNEEIVLPEIQTMTGYIRRHYEADIIAEAKRKLHVGDLCVRYGGKIYRACPWPGPADYGEEEMEPDDSELQAATFPTSAGDYARFADIRPLNGEITWMNFWRTGSNFVDPSRLKMPIRISSTLMTWNLMCSMLNNHIRPAFGCYRVTAIQHESIQVFINRLFAEGYARATLVNLLALLSCSLRYAKRQRWIQFNPAEDIDLPTTRACVNQRHKLREPVPREVMQKIFERFPEGSPVHLPFMLAYHCGLRLGEVFGLTWKDVDLEQGRLVVNQQMQWRTTEGKYQLTPPKYDSTRRVMLDPVILDLLKRTREQQLERRNHYGTLHVRNFIDRYGYLNQNGDGEEMEFLMVREDGSFLHRTVIDYASKVIKRELGQQQFDFHSLRHTHATELSEYGVNLKEIQRRLGHKTLEVTVRTYLHATDVMEAESMQIMKQMYGTT